MTTVAIWKPMGAVACCLRISLALATPQAASAQQRVANESEVKAACLLNFAKFIEWPTEAFSSEKSPLIFGVLGEDPFGDALK